MVGEVETLVVGGGAMGSATAWALARRGREVLLAERFEPGHAMGASHGEYRNFNVAYAEPDYVQLLVEARRLWGELEADSGEALLELVGLVNHGEAAAHQRSGSSGGDTFDTVHAALDAAGIASEFLSASEAHERWPGMRFETRVLFSPESGRVKADASVAALQRLAARLGAEVRHRTRAVGIRVLDDDFVEVDLESGDGDLSTVRTRSLVVTAGAWTEKLLGARLTLPRLVVTQEQPAHFAPRDPALAWPSFNHQRDLGPGGDYWYSGVYGMLTPGTGVKAGWHGTGLPIDPDARTFTSEPAQLAALQRYAREWLPGVDPERFEEISCTYTSTDTADFVLDRVGPITVGAGFSGHGFKFTPAVGRILADLATTGTRPAARFALQR
ncbi:N-methyltryptophan oxidase [Frondihabitans sucicola]|uniref:N-methyltryptophan oxidase n=1 Tax=Frondihabitans sucicola TaxID=1268041 RepID=A0ABM8GI61_9MICO|nr:FAD-dependent oxidoreductase [Frondihabitans sucicola]BDZ48054.1 N-methyltryptophan oxidase [Frondihabitans sucicola]